MRSVSKKALDGSDTILCSPVSADPITYETKYIHFHETYFISREGNEQLTLDLEARASILHDVASLANGIERYLEGILCSNA